MPLDTSVKHYTSSMNGVPTLLNTTANSLIRILDAVLVNGFGDVTLTSLSVTNNIATATVSTGYTTAPYCVVTIAGATPAELNGDKKILSNTATTFTFEANGVSNGVATGTITCRFPGAGWTKVYANTTANVAVYRNSSGTFFRVNDSNGRNAYVFGYENMTDVNTGTNQFPSSFDLTNGIWFSKANSTSRPWWIIADSKTCYTANEFDGNGAMIPHFAMGDFKSYIPSDFYNTFLTGRTSEVNNRSGSEAYYINTNTNAVRLQLKRKYNGTTPSVTAVNRFFRSGSLTTGISGGSAGSPLVYPNLTDGKLFLVPMYILESSTILRGEYRGLYVCPQNINATSEFFLENEALVDFPTPGKILIYKGIAKGATNPGGFFIDISGPWD